MPDTPHRNGPRPFLTSADWSTGLGAPTSLSQAQILGALGRQLRSAYQELLNEPVPAHLTNFVHRLADEDPAREKAD